MLPRSAALEFDSADNLGGEGETGSERRGKSATVVQHGRRETREIGRNPLKAKRSGRDGDWGLGAPQITVSRVLVLDQQGSPLMPCSPARAWKLLKSTRVRVHRLAPFVIRQVDKSLVAVFLVKDPTRLAKLVTQPEPPLKDRGTVYSTRWALWREPPRKGLATFSGSDGKAHWNRFEVANSRNLDALCLGQMGDVTSYPVTAIRVKVTGRGSYSHIRPDKHGFPLLGLSRVKSEHGFQTGDLARAAVPSCEVPMNQVGRAAVRSPGCFNITAATSQRQHHSGNITAATSQRQHHSERRKHAGNQSSPLHAIAA